MLRVTTPPNGQVITTQDAKSWAKINATGDAPTDTAADQMIDDLVDGFTRLCEIALNGPILPTVYELALDRFPVGRQPIDLRCLRITALASVTYVAPGGGAPLTLSTSVYSLNNIDEPNRLDLKPDQSWPPVDAQTPNAVRVTFTAGFADAQSVPNAIKHWLRAHIATATRNPEAFTEKKLEALPYLSSLLQPWALSAFC